MRGAYTHLRTTPVFLWFTYASLGTVMSNNLQCLDPHLSLRTGRGSRSRWAAMGGISAPGWARALIKSLSTWPCSLFLLQKIQPKMKWLLNLSSNGGSR